jgi:hypothetical protein
MSLCGMAFGPAVAFGAVASGFRYAASYALMLSWLCLLLHTIRDLLSTLRMSARKRRLLQALNSESDSDSPGGRADDLGYLDDVDYEARYDDANGDSEGHEDGEDGRKDEPAGLQGRGERKLAHLHQRAESMPVSVVVVSCTAVAWSGTERHGNDAGARPRSWARPPWTWPWA